MTQDYKRLLFAAFILALGAFFIYADLILLGSVFVCLGGLMILNLIASYLPFSRVFYWIHASAFELLAILGMAVFRFVPEKQILRGKGKPILLIHGYLNHGSVWRVLKRKLENVGLGPIYTVNLGSPFRSIRNYAEKVKEKAEAIAAETQREDLILIGHSMGGLVAAWYATQLAPPNTVSDVITIGTPLFGTMMAHIGVGANAREMEPNSPFLQELRDAIALNKQIRFRHLATKSDLLIFPGMSAVIEENEHVFFDHLGHAGLLYSSRAVDQIARWLASYIQTTR